MASYTQDDKFKSHFSWSVSKVETLNYCQRQFFYKHYTNALKNIDFDLYLDTLLKKNLSSIQLWVGNKVHEEIAKLLRFFSKPNTYQINIKEYLDKTFKKIEEDMTREFLLSEKKDYSKYDKNNKFGLIEHLNEIATKKELSEAINHVYDCINAFTKFDYFELIESKITTSKYFIEDGDDWNRKKYISGKFPDVELWISPDFWIEYEPQKFAIFDWKTGEKPSDNFSETYDFKKPLITYAFRLYYETIKNQNNSNDLEDATTIEGYNVYLPGGDVFGGIINNQDIIGFDCDVILKDVEILSKYLRNSSVKENIPLPITEFKKTNHIKKCNICVFKETCNNID